MRASEMKTTAMVPTMFLSAVFVTAAILLLAPSSATGWDRPSPSLEQWQSIGPWGGSAFALAMAKSETSRLYMAARHGVYRSDDCAKHWYLPDGGSLLDIWISALAVCPTDPDFVIAAGFFTDKIYRTTDGGKSWTPAVVGPAWGRPRSVSFSPQDPNTLLLSVSGSGGDCIYKSTDAGLSWYPSYAGIVTLPPGELVFHPTNGLVALVGSPDGIYRTSNAGQSWSLVYAGGNAWTSPSLSWCAGDPSRVYGVIGGCGQRVCGIPLKSDDEGLTFSEMNEPQSLPGGLVCGLQIVRAHPINPDIVFLGAIIMDCVATCWSAYVYVTRSVDAGDTWTTTFSRTDLGYDDIYPEDILVDPANPALVYLAIYTLAGPRAEGVRRSETGGAGDWHVHMQGIGEFGILEAACDSLGVLCVRTTRGDSTYVAAEPGGEWTATGAPRYGGSYGPKACEINNTTGAIHEIGTYWRGDYNDYLWERSTDAGQSWSGHLLWPYPVWDAEPRVITSNHGLGEVIYFWENYAQEVYRSDDWGENFALVSQGFGAVAAVVDPGDPARLFALDVAAGTVRLSEDAGVSWEIRSGGLPADEPVDLFMDREAANRLLVVYKDAGVYESADAGSTWAAMTLNLGGAAIVAADWDARTDRVFLATDSAGVFVRGLGFVNRGLLARGFRTITYWPQQETLLVGTTSQSLMALSLEPFVTGVEVASSVPPKIIVSPNPFKQETTIRFTVPPLGSAVDLAVYSIEGRRVRTILKEWKRGGSWSQRWDGRDEAGVPVAAGVYFVRCALGAESLTQQVVLLR